ncbi:hypothetical protein [Thermodesulfovibrio sp. Kuro-1]|uniref:hypothetical protein n=1 Tax=Thermodesulfovibrio sp. Kuro-1 TaxID=2580394 RepID=UPI0015E859B1|nr:hypothetical protein [Thermodesulfovibrio sp. Kuro-1]
MGWATWANRWRYFDLNMNSMDSTDFIDELITYKPSNKYWKDIFKKMKENKIDSWGYIWTFYLWKNKKISIIPNVNLVSNIGFGTDGTHTLDPTSKFSNMPKAEMVLTTHPNKIEIDLEADEYTSKKQFSYKPFLVRAFNKLKRILTI